MSVYNNVIFKDFNLTPRAKKAYNDAYEISKELGHSNVNNLHVLYGCIKNGSSELNTFLLNNGVSICNEDIIEVIQKAKKQNDDKFFSTENSDPWHKEVADAVKEANNISHSLDQYYVGIEHVMLGIIHTSSYIFKHLENFILDFNSLKNKLNDFISGEDEYEDINLFNELRAELPEDAVGFDEEESTLPSFITSLNKMYIDGKLPDVYGRDSEVNLLIETLSKKNKCNAILTGDAGVGKTAIVECLANRICDGEVPSNLLGMEIFNVDLASMLAGTQYRGQFEQKFKKLLNLAKDNPSIVLFFDEIHTIFGAGGNQEGSLDAANMLKPFLARGEIKCIGATTTQEHEKIFKKDSAIKRRFFNININEPTVEDTKKILYNCKKKYEDFHNVKFNKPIIDCIVDLCDTVISHKRFPDKAFDVIDQVGSRVKIKNLQPSKEIIKSHDSLVDFLAEGNCSVEQIKEEFGRFLKKLKDFNEASNKERTTIKKEDVLEIIAEHGKISIDQVNKSKQGFNSFLTRMGKDIFGQSETISKINDLLACAKAGLTEENKPLASMFFVGPTSVGKTYTAKKIAKHYFGNERAMLQINMSELYDKTGISKLIGANSGYVGYEEGGSLTKFVKDNPNCVVLFDEVEKADPQILNILLHLLDEGYIEDNKHEKIDFSRSIVILTSNIGHDKASEKSMGFVQDDTPKSESYKQSVKKNLKPELLARINDVMVFNDLKDEDLKRIVSFELNKIKTKLLKNKIEVKFTSKTIDCIFNKIKTNKLHARDIKSFIRENVQVPVAKIVVKNSKISEISVKSVDNKINVC